MSRARPNLSQTTKLVARALGITPEQLNASLRKATQADLPAMLDLRARILGDYLTWDDVAYLNWRYRLGRDDAGQGDMWVLEHQGQMLALVGTEDLRAQWQGHEWSVLSSMDIMIEPKVGDIGLGAWLNLTLQNKGADLVLAIGSNPRSFGLVTRLFDPLPNRRSFVYPLRFDHLLAKRIPIAPLVWPLAKLAQWVLKASRLVLLGPSQKRYRVQAVSAMTPHWSTALDTMLTSNANPQHLHLQRTAAYLEWRVLRNPKGAGQLWGAWDGDKLLAYVTTHTEAVDAHRTALIISDVGASMSPESQPAWRQLLHAILNDAQAKGHEYAKLTSYRSDVETEFKRIGARQRFNEFETLSYTCSDRVRQQMPAPAADWTLNDIHTDRV